MGSLWLMLLCTSVHLLVWFISQNFLVYGLWVIMLPVTGAFLWGVHHFKNLERASGSFPIPLGMTGVIEPCLNKMKKNKKVQSAPEALHHDKKAKLFFYGLVLLLVIILAIIIAFWPFKS